MPDTATGSDDQDPSEIAVIADEFGALIIGTDDALTDFADEWDQHNRVEVAELPAVQIGTTLSSVTTALLATGKPVARYLPGADVWEKSGRPRPGTVVTFHRTVRSAESGKILSNTRIAPVAAVPGVGQAAIAALTVQMALEQFAERIIARLDDIEDKVDDVLRLASAQRLGDVYGHRRILQRRIQELGSGVALTDTDWSSIAALGADLEVGVERLRRHALLLTDQLNPDDSADKRADQLESAVHQGRLKETLKLLLVAQHSLYLWQRLRLERVRSAEPEYLEQTAASARATLSEHLEADHDLASRLRDVLDRHTVLRVTEVHRQLAGRKLTKNRDALSHTVDSFIEARALQIGSWGGADNATIREAWSLARDRTVAAANSGRRQLSAGATAVARWVEPKDDSDIPEPVAATPPAEVPRTPKNLPLATDE
ncbi:hypothetical protein [Nocardia sp. NRRL WC-3656]|uniref:hypothetical protein n=1 Tax=Nocardia sp. NRRL WC-3656 TaxID=1463824 RepID=UPI000A575F70|nr:hypothetical protein [Nocardia sp. NRRL WC-3656]